MMATALTFDDLNKACNLYSTHPHYDLSYLKLRKATLPSLDLRIPSHRRELLTWLNDWGCRLPEKYLYMASEEIRAWYEKYWLKLPAVERDLLELDEAAISELSILYDDLKCRRGGYKNKVSGLEARTIGPTAASKVLFALRPRVAMPWDGFMRKQNGYKSDSATEYRAFLRKAQSVMREVEKLCAANGLTLSDLPARLGQHHSSPYEILNKYLWAVGR